MIRYLVKNDFSGIISLWQEAFGDSENEIMTFLNSRYKGENTIIYEADGEIASMLFLLEGQMSVGKELFKSYYLYAACTRKKYRGKGMMAALLDFANETARIRGVDFICLMPGSAELFEFYSKHGYKTAFERKIITVSCDDLPAFGSGSFAEEATESFSLEEIRRNAFAGIDMFVWDSEAIDFAFVHSKMYSLSVIRTRKGYAIYSTKGKETHVKEFAFPPSEFSRALSLIAAESSAKTIHLSVPVQYNAPIKENAVIPSGMLIAVDNKMQIIANNISCAYLGLTLD